ncbi:MAG: hypothetical protein ACKVOM_04250 [Ferruginibacter sp.]
MKKAKKQKRYVYILPIFRLCVFAVKLLLCENSFTHFLCGECCGQKPKTRKKKRSQKDIFYNLPIFAPLRFCGKTAPLRKLFYSSSLR